jgi:hypothetical protein
MFGREERRGGRLICCRRVGDGWQAPAAPDGGEDATEPDFQSIARESEHLRRISWSARFLAGAWAMVAEENILGCVAELLRSAAGAVGGRGGMANLDRRNAVQIASRATTRPVEARRIIISVVWDFAEKARHKV